MVQLFFEDTEDDKISGAGNLFQYFTTRTEKAPPLRRRRIGPCSHWQVYRRSPARGGRRKKSDGLRSPSAFQREEVESVIGSAKKSARIYNMKG